MRGGFDKIIYRSYVAVGEWSELDMSSSVIYAIYYAKYKNQFKSR